MKTFVLEKQSEFEAVFTSRSYNPPLHKNAEFEREFETVISRLREILSVEASDRYYLWEGHNWSRFIDVSFSSQIYLNRNFVNKIASFLKEQLHDWMICLWESCYIFVTKDMIFGYDPIAGDLAFTTLFEELNSVKE